MIPIRVVSSEYTDIETGKKYWSVAWSFTFNGQEYGDYILSGQERYGQGECLRNATSVVFDKAEDIYNMLIEQEKLKG